HSTFSMKMHWPGLWITLCLFSMVCGGKVLVFPMDGSHWVNMNVIIEALHSRGHQVSVVRSSKDFITEFVGQLLAIQREGKSLWTRYKLEKEQAEKSLEMNEKMSKILEMLFENKELMQSIQNAKYDLVLTDPMSPIGAIVAHYFGLPLVFNVRWTSHGEGHFAIAPSPLSYVPLTGTELSDKMSFFERMFNVFMFSFWEYQIAKYVLPSYAGMIEKYLGPDIDYKSLFQAADLWLMRVDFVFEFPRPTMPNVIYMGGFQCKPKHGIIIIYKGDRPASLGNNTLLVDWMPQTDLLRHPKIKLFVAHGGTNGVQEAIYHGVPILGLPLIFDQRDNLFRIEVRGAGKIVDFFTMNEHTFLQGIQEVLNDPTYTTNMQILSQLHRDQPMKPLDTALFWIEFVMRHTCAAHQGTESYKLLCLKRKEKSTANLRE
uniref:UDP-glucuronosyltransferase n=1 Tax=Mola mola TaxID=94237 RepID=A0A3Q3X1F6_MOLML